MVENEVIAGDLIIPTENSPEFIQIIDEIDIDPFTGEYIWKTGFISPSKN